MAPFICTSEDCRHKATDKLTASFQDTCFVHLLCLCTACVTPFICTSEDCKHKAADKLTAYFQDTCFVDPFCLCTARVTPFSSAQVKVADADLLTAPSKNTCFVQHSRLCTECVRHSIICTGEGCGCSPAHKLTAFLYPPRKLAALICHACVPPLHLHR